MEENNEQIESSKEGMKEDVKGFFHNMKLFLKELLDFRNDTDHEATITAITSDISIKGATTWILICSIFVASIGLNANSTAVVIGAMLISPLMGPILGVGLSIAINDIDTLRKSMINLLTMIVVSLLTAFVFFYVFPLSQDTSELLGRTKPDIRDVLIAFFGGLALIIARTKKGTIASVIFGVAIATALMPPLCTVGYGLAKWVKGDAVGLQYATGALYLFLINTIFIALATFLVLKFLGFTMIRYVDSQKRKRIAKMASLLAIVAMIPAIITFINVYNSSMIDMKYKDYLNNEILSNNDLWLQRENIDIEGKKINLFFNGDVAESTVTYLQNEIQEYGKLSGFELVVRSNKKKSVDRIVTAYDRAIEELDQKDNVIRGLQTEITDFKVEIKKLQKRIEAKAKSRDKNSVAFSSIAKDAKIRFSHLNRLGYSKTLVTSDFIKVDTIFIVSVKWDNKLKKVEKLKKQKELQSWLKKEMRVGKIIVKRF